LLQLAIERMANHYREERWEVSEGRELLLVPRVVAEVRDLPAVVHFLSQDINRW
jgi:hypothetical protein